MPQLIETAVAGVLPAARAEADRASTAKLVPDGLPPIEGDPKRLHQVLGNVLANAVKFTPERGRIEIRGAADGRRIAIEVRDDGVGIAPEFLPHVFDRFRQADSRSTRRHGGLGLGLAIARHLRRAARRRDSTPTATGPGRGTTITIRLPAGASACRRAALPPAPAARQPGELRLDGATVVVVDDQRDSCELLAALLRAVRRAGRAVRLAPTARSWPLPSAAVHLLVADIAMPDVDGYD